VRDAIADRMPVIAAALLGEREAAQ
jgi:hypothetical protein